MRDAELLRNARKARDEVRQVGTHCRRRMRPALPVGSMTRNTRSQLPCQFSRDMRDPFKPNWMRVRVRVNEKWRGHSYFFASTSSIGTRPPKICSTQSCICCSNVTVRAKLMYFCVVEKLS